MTLADLNLSSEAKEKLKDLLEEASVFQTTGVSNANGADSYQCPCCLEYSFIMGNASARNTMHAVEHDSNCALFRLYNDLHSGV